MLLFHKRTKKAIKYVWGFISVLIVLSMVVTYSGFTMLAQTAPTQDTTQQLPDVPGSEQNTLSPEVRAVLDTANASNTLQLKTNTPESQTLPLPETEPVQQLKLSL